MKKVTEFLINEIEDNSTLVVACSGGPDSMCLLSLLCDLKEKKNLNIIVAHVNHKLRKESDEEAIQVKNYCLNNDMTFALKELNEFKTGKFNEAIARKKRYEFFNELIDKFDAKYLLTAHHGDDLIETVLMRLTRGSNLNGYVGIKKKSVNEAFITLRPLLFVTKKEIFDYLKENIIEYAVDVTNDSEKYTRNRYRKTVLPFLKNEDENVHLKYLQFSEELNDYNNFVNNYIIEKRFIVDNQIFINRILEESDFIKKKTIELLIKDIQTLDNLDVNNKQMKEMIKLINDNVNKTIDLNNDYQAMVIYGAFLIKKVEIVNDFEFVLDGNLYTKDFSIITDLTEVGDSNYEIRLNSNDLVLPLIVRNRKNGDKIEIKNLNGSKKVKDIFIDEKIDVIKRDSLPIVLDSNNKIVWIPGIKKSKFAKDKNEKYDIILKYEVINK